MSARLALACMAMLVQAVSTIAPLTDAELAAYSLATTHPQPMWQRDPAGVCSSAAHSGAPTCKMHALLEQAAQLHQVGDYDGAIDALKKVLKDDAGHIEAHASLAKVLDDQGKLDLANKARAKARKAAHELARQAPF